MQGAVRCDATRWHACGVLLLAVGVLPGISILAHKGRFGSHARRIQALCEQCMQLKHLLESVHTSGIVWAHAQLIVRRTSVFGAS